MAERNWNELIEQMNDQVFPGREELLDWLVQHPEAQVHHTDVPEEQATKAADARRIWEIRSGTTRRGGLQTGYMEEAVRVLRAVEASTPELPIVVRSVEASDRHWFILSAGADFLASFWVERRTSPPNMCHLCARQLPPATLDYAIARIRELAASTSVPESEPSDSLHAAAAANLREGMLLLADELEGLCAKCRQETARQ